MATWCEKVDVENMHDETFDILCSLCKSKDRNKEAEKYCVDCHDYYCCECVKFHEDIPALLRHKILEKGQFKLIPRQEITIAPTERCDKHSHNHVDMYCQNHDIVGCPTCMATDHRLDRKIKLHGCNAMTCKVKGRRTCNVKIPSDEKNCYISSVCLLENGTVILADNNNKKLKHVEIETCTVIDNCNLDDKPWQVCSINKQEVAVSCLMDGIHFISLQTKMMTTRQIKTDHISRGLAYAVGQLYISDRSSIYIYNMSGKKLKKLSIDQGWYSYFKPALFSCINGLSVSDDGSKIYVADGEKGLIALYNTGKIIGKFDGPQLLCARHVCVTENGSILVTGLRTKNVLQFGPHCELLGEVLTTDKEDKKPATVCFDHTSSKIIVTYKEQNEIEEYDLL